MRKGERKHKTEWCSNLTGAWKGKDGPWRLKLCLNYNSSDLGKEKVSGGPVGKPKYKQRKM